MFEGAEVMFGDRYGLDLVLHCLHSSNSLIIQL